MTSSKTLEGPLAKAAAALEAELARYERNVADARELEIGSEKDLHRSKAALEACAEAEQRMREHLDVFASAMRDMQRRQEACVAGTLEEARRIEARVQDRAALLERFGGLGERAREVDAPVQEILRRRAEGAADHELLGALSEVVTRTEAVLSDAGAVAEAAEARGWEDIAAQARALRDELATAKAKVEGAHRDISARLPS